MRMTSYEIVMICISVMMLLLTLIKTFIGKDQK